MRSIIFILLLSGVCFGQSVTAYCATTGTAQVNSGVACSAGINGGAATLLLVGVANSASTPACSQISPSLSSSFTALTVYGTGGGNPDTLICYQKSPTTGAGETFTCGSGAFCFVVFFSGVSGNNDADVGGCFYSACNGANSANETFGTNSTVVGITPSASGDILFVYLGESSSNDASMIGKRCATSSGLTNCGTPTNLTVIDRYEGASATQGFYWVTYNSVTQVFLAGTISASFATVGSAGAWLASAASGSITPARGNVF